jgi:3-carboxy-cis,cis-muconate cycloisomerase
MESLMRRLLEILAELAARHRDTLMAGRTHGQHAVPITFGFKVAVWVAELIRHRDRLQRSKPQLLVGQLAGAAGTLASLGRRGMDVQALLCSRLGLSAPAIAWHSSRDTFAEFAGWLAMVGTTLEKIAHEIVLLQKTEVGELAEAYEPSKGASSTMPQKRNPATCEAVIALGNMLRQQVPAMLAAMAPEHERDWWALHVEWKTLPEMCLMCSGSLELCLRMLRGLRVDAERMRRNLDQTRGLIMAEAVLFHFAPAVGRSAGHDLVYRASMNAVERGIPLSQALLEDLELGEQLRTADAAELEVLLDPANYTGQAADWVDRILAQV